MKSLTFLHIQGMDVSKNVSLEAEKNKKRQIKLTDERKNLQLIKDVFEKLGCGAALTRDLTMITAKCYDMNEV